MTRDEAKAEAEKIIEMFMEARDYHGRKILKPTAYQCAIIHVKGILKAWGVPINKQHEAMADYWNSILTELNKM